MNFASRFEKVFRTILPSPFTIAVVLTLLTMLLALVFGEFHGGENELVQILGFWQKGLWEPPLLVFTVQMMLILVLGHTLALSAPVNMAINRIISFADSAVKAAFLITLSTMLVAFFNWGLGLIFGAIIARKTGEKFAESGKSLNYPLIGAAAYSGMMVWHGGISGSAPIKVGESGHLQNLMQSIATPAEISALPDTIPFEATIFSPMNLTASIILLLVLPLGMALLASRSKSAVPLPKSEMISANSGLHKTFGAEKLERSNIPGIFFALIILGFACYIPFIRPSGFGFITPDYINFTLLGLCLFFHRNFRNFLRALDKAIGGASGILIQFPLYFGIMAVMKSTGLIEQLSQFFISISNDTTFPIFTFFSAGLVNIFIPSGGGQWAVQGPVIIQAAGEMNVPLSKGVMALAYGDQLTNMLQPFWALPLLAITGLKARDILPYTLMLLLLGAVIFISVLLFF